MALSQLIPLLYLPRGLERASLSGFPDRAEPSDSAMLGESTLMTLFLEVRRCRKLLDDVLRVRVGGMPGRCGFGTEPDLFCSRSAGREEADVSE